MVAMSNRPDLPPFCASRPRNIQAPVAPQSIGRQCLRGGKGNFHVQLVSSRRLHANDCPLPGSACSHARMPERGAADPAPQLQIGVRDRARLAMTPRPLIPGTPAWRLTLNFDVRSIIVLRATLAHRGMRRRATAHQTRLAERAGYRRSDGGPRGAAKAVRSIVRQTSAPRSSHAASSRRSQGPHPAWPRP
jgi:hypothetical protein